MKECQQSQVYAAERTVAPGFIMNLRQSQAFIDNLLRQEWWGETFPNVSFVEVFRLPPGAPCSVGGYTEHPGGRGVGQLEMLPDHMRDLYMCHELAHVCAAAKFNSKSHDPWFAAIYKLLVFHACGWERCNALGQAFLDHGVDAWVDIMDTGAIPLTPPTS